MKTYAKYVATSEERDALDVVDALVNVDNNYHSYQSLRDLLLFLNRAYARVLRAEQDTTEIRIASKNLRNFARQNGMELDSCKYRKNVKTTDVNPAKRTISQIVDSLI